MPVPLASGPRIGSNRRGLPPARTTRTDATPGTAPGRKPMIGPLPPTPPPDRPELPRVRLDVRPPGGRPTTYEVSGDEFLIGGAAGCDLRVSSAPPVPPVICQVIRKPDGVRVRRLTPVLLVLLNGEPITGTVPVSVDSDDVIGFAGWEVVIRILPTSPTYVAARLVSLDPHDPVPPSPAAAAAGVSPTSPLSAPAELALDPDDVPHDEALVRQRTEPRLQNEELPAERALGSRRRPEIEAEAERLRLVAQALDQRRAELEARAAELDQLRAALEVWAKQQRRELAEELHKRRQEAEAELRRLREEAEARHAADQARQQELHEAEARLAAAGQELARQRELFAADRAWLDQERTAFETYRRDETARLAAWATALAEREAELDRRAAQAQAEQQRLAAERQTLEVDRADCHHRAATLHEQERQLAERARELDARLEQLRRDAAEWEETVRLATAEQLRLQAEAERLDRHKAELDAQSARLAEQASQLEAQRAVLTLLQATLDRTRQELEREAEALAIARTRQDQALAELHERIREAERLHHELAAAQADTARERHRLQERDLLLAASLHEIRAQREALAEEARRLNARQAELDARTAEFAELAGALKGRLAQALDLQARLEADRVALREREAALARAEQSCQEVREQFRRRAEELAERSRSLEEAAAQLANERVAYEQARRQAEADHRRAQDELADARHRLDARAAELERAATELAARQDQLARQATRLKKVGAALAARRKALHELRTVGHGGPAPVARSERSARKATEAPNPRVSAEAEPAYPESPTAEHQPPSPHERPVADGPSPRPPDPVATQGPSAGPGEVTVGPTEPAVADGPTVPAGVVASEASSSSASPQISRRPADPATTGQHLEELRLWYRQQLRELAQGVPARSGSSVAGPRGEPAGSRNEPRSGPGDLRPTDPAPEEPDPADRQLGELLRSRGLVDAETLTALWAEAARQRRSLRQVLLNSGVLTLHQLALIEADNLDALVLGRFHVIDRVRTTPREAVYRVIDPSETPTKTAPASGGRVFLLRHLTESAAQDAAWAEEFRRRFAAAREVTHPNVVAVHEVVEIAGRPAVVLEWVTGLVSSEWPAYAANPGCWVRLATMAAQGLAAAHRHGLVHGQLTADSFLLTPSGILKVGGWGEPPWLAPDPAPATEPGPAADLQAFGRIGAGWARLGARQARRPMPRTRAYVATWERVLRRLEAEPEPPMADVIPTDRPYDSATELLDDLHRLARETPFHDDAWEKLLRYVADHVPGRPELFRRSA